MALCIFQIGNESQPHVESGGEACRIVLASVGLWPSRAEWKAATWQHIQSQVQKGVAMTAQRMCELCRVSRASLYRFEPEAEHPDENLDLRDEIQRIALAFPCYG